MTQDVPVPTVPTYASVTEVSQVLQRGVPAASASEGDPSLAQWNASILAAEEEIDTMCGQAWRERRVTEEVPYDGLGNMPDPEGFVLVPLSKMHIRTLSSAGTTPDKLEVWNGSQYDDWLTTRTLGRNADWYAVPDLGHLRLRTRVLYGNTANRVRVTYRYGKTTVPYNVKRAAALLAAAGLATGQRDSQHGHGEGLETITPSSRVQAWQAEAMRLLTPYVAAGGL